MPFQDVLTRCVVAVAAAIAAMLALLSLNASAQAAWPNHPIKLIVPFTPGGTTTTSSRAL